MCIAPRDDSRRDQRGEDDERSGLASERVRGAADTVEPGRVVAWDEEGLRAEQSLILCRATECEHEEKRKHRASRGKQDRRVTRGSVPTNGTRVVREGGRALDDVPRRPYFFL